VIDEAFQWKRELVKVADRLEAKTKQVRWTNRTGYLIERDFVMSAYAMRRLIESNSLSETLRQRHIPARRFELTGPPPEPALAADIENSYDFDNGRRTTLSVVELCDEIMRSFVFVFFVGQTADLFDGIYISADRDKRKRLHLLLASDYIALCVDIGAEHRGETERAGSGHPRKGPNPHCGLGPLLGVGTQDARRMPRLSNSSRSDSDRPPQMP
jgi:hypothetical protein